MTCNCTAVITHVIPKLESSKIRHRQGAIEAMASIVHQLGLDFIPYIVLFIVPVLGRMSDQVWQYWLSSFNGGIQK
jgi:TATA-binding protein-associated factor